MGFFYSWIFEALWTGVARDRYEPITQKEQLAVYTTMCTQRLAYFWGTWWRHASHPLPIRWRKTRGEPITAYITDARTERCTLKGVTNSQKGGITILKRIKRKRKTLESSFLISRPRKLGLEDTPRRKFCFVGSWAFEQFRFFIFYSRILVCVIRFRYDIIF